jgi:hypothetical protein
MDKGWNEVYGVGEPDSEEEWAMTWPLRFLYVALGALLMALIHGPG